MQHSNSKFHKTESSRTKYSSFKRVENVAGGNSSLAKLLQRANNIMAHQETVRAILEPSCRSHCWLANYHNGTLYLQTDSSAWGARLRMQQRSIVQQLKSTPAFNSLHSVKVIIQPRYTTEVVRRKAKIMSADNAEQIIETASEIDDQALKAALVRLAKTSQTQRNRNDK